MISYRGSHALAIVAFTTLYIGAVDARAADDKTATRNHDGTITVKVAGSGVDGLHAAIIHSQEPTPTGMIQRSTETVEIDGDMKGRVLYHVTSVFDFVHGTLVNTGDQVFSGTVAGSAPVMIHDDEFRFEINLVTGKDTGRVYLLDHIAGPKVRCTLVVVGTGVNADGNPTFNYTGECTLRRP